MLYFPGSLFCFCSLVSLPYIGVQMNSSTFEADTQMTGVNDRSAAEDAGIIPSTRRLSGLSQTARSGFLRKDRSLPSPFHATSNAKPRQAGGRVWTSLVGVGRVACM